jgi:Tfp pilus assembly protein PilV
LSATAGLSLIETIVAAAIIAIAALTMILAFTTMGNINLKSAQLNTDTEGLEAGISSDLLEDNQVEKDSEEGELSFTVGKETYTINGTYNTYTSKQNGSSFTLFEDPKPPASSGS